MSSKIHHEQKTHDVEESLVDKVATLRVCDEHRTQVATSCKDPSVHSSTSHCVELVDVVGLCGGREKARQRVWEFVRSVCSGEVPRLFSSSSRPKSIYACFSMEGESSAFLKLCHHRQEGSKEEVEWKEKRDALFRSATACPVSLDTAHLDPLVEWEGEEGEESRPVTVGGGMGGGEWRDRERVKKRDDVGRPRVNVDAVSRLLRFDLGISKKEADTRQKEWREGVKSGDMCGETDGEKSTWQRQSGSDREKGERRGRGRRRW
jgi:hypothetical protein